MNEAIQALPRYLVAAVIDIPIAGYEHCTVNALGIVKHQGKPLAQCDNGRGYLKVAIPLPDGKKRSLRVHRLVACACIPNSDGLPVVNHIDGNKHNNRAANLEWVTYKQNTEKSLAIKTPETKPVARLGKNGKALEVFLSINQAAKAKQCDYRGLYEAVKSGHRYKGSRWVHCEIDIKLEEI